MAARRSTLAVGLVLAIGAGWCRRAETLVPADRRAALQAFDLALQALTQRARFVVDAIAPGPDPTRTLKRYILAHDPHGDYLTPVELRHYRAASREDHAGIGVELARDPRGALRILPDPDGPAARAGLQSGTRLLAVDGQPVQDLALPSVAALAAGAHGATLDLLVITPEGRSMQVSVPRSRRTGPAVQLQFPHGRRVIRIRSFTPDTRQELEYLLRSETESHPCIIDLRGCAGGDLLGAVDCAMLFLPKGTVLGSLDRGKTVEVWRCGRDLKPFGGDLVLWQDEGTASAAEVLLSALVDNQRAITVGRRTFGKGSVQELISIPGGAALILSTGEVLGPRGRKIDGRGLPAQREVLEAGNDPGPWLSRSVEAGHP